MNDDWRYSDDKLKLRQQALTILLAKYGSELDSTRKSKYTSQSIYECAHDWVSQGNVNCNGITAYYEACLLYTSPSPRDQRGSRMPSSA